MSRVAKKPIAIPEKTEVKVSGVTVSVKGPLGEIVRDFVPGIEVKAENGTVLVTLKRPEDYVVWGTTASHIKNMLEGVTKGFSRKLIVEGIGFKSDVKNGKLEMSLGYSHPVSIEIPKDLKVTAEKNVITVSGVSAEKVGEFAAMVRAKKKPEPYKGKGIRYDDEVIRRKQGKKAA